MAKMEIHIIDNQNPSATQIYNALCPDVVDVEVFEKEGYPYFFDIYVDGNLAEQIVSSDDGSIEITEELYSKIAGLQTEASNL